MRNVIRLARADRRKISPIGGLPGRKISLNGASHIATWG
ncbi:hypothetical protein Z947_4084 [Sulfitobacter geojensis]|nr:hypothetical protein Z947_4084 [Sulfitobacter geojensis]